MSEIEHLVMPALRAAGRPTTYENQERMRKALMEAAATQKRNQRTMSEISGKEAIERAVSKAMGWMPTEDGPGYHETRGAVLAEIEAAAHARAKAEG